MTLSRRRALGETMVKVRASIEQIRGHGEHVSEQDTKAILIDPILAALGWELNELDDVRREYRYKPQDNPVDYALFIFGRPRLFVEAKALGSTLDRKCASQVLGYASVVGVGWCLLTNGDEYRLYNSAANVDVDKKLFRTICLSDHEATDYCLETLQLIGRDEMGETELDALWKSQFVDRLVKEALEALFSGEESTLPRSLHKRLPELTLAEIRESLRRASVNVHFPAVSLPASATAPASRVITQHATTASPGSPVRMAVTLADLIAARLMHPPLRLERTYKGVELAAIVERDGKVGFEVGASAQGAVCRQNVRRTCLAVMCRDEWSVGPLFRCHGSS
jgi:predicted type IV restriction endonuclease